MNAENPKDLLLNVQNSEITGSQSDWIFELRGVGRSFGAHKVLCDLDFKVARGEFVAVVGASGSGKTTLLNLLAGFDAPDEGTLERRGAARTVYQSDGLFPWLTVAGNIALGLRHLPSIEREKTGRELLEWSGLPAFAAYYPHQLSGGMRQRVEIARALSGDSDILLLDEPFSALDYLTRLKMRGELSKMLSSRPRAVVLVTHDIEEAAQLADRVVVLAGQPACICDEIRPAAPRPRGATDPAVVEATRRIIEYLDLNH
jgi:NitT/TauT family transport system ATP-binding protein